MSRIRLVESLDGNRTRRVVARKKSTQLDLLLEHVLRGRRGRRQGAQAPKGERYCQHNDEGHERGMERVPSFERNCPRRIHQGKHPCQSHQPEGYEVRFVPIKPFQLHETSVQYRRPDDAGGGPEFWTLTAQLHRRDKHERDQQPQRDCELCWALKQRANGEPVGQHCGDA